MGCGRSALLTKKLFYAAWHSSQKLERKLGGVHVPSKAHPYSRCHRAHRVPQTSPPYSTAATTTILIPNLLLLPVSSCSHAGDPRGHAAPAPTGRPAVGTDAARRGKADLVGGRVEAVLVVDRGQDLVDVCLEHHAAHDDLVEDVVNLSQGGGWERDGIVRLMVYLCI